MRGAGAALVACVVLAAWPGAAAAEPWSLLRSENRNVREGNEKLAANDTAGAVEAYDRAARELPSEGGVHLNRGLALLSAKKAAEAREALKLAVQSKADPATRADAHYDLGLSFYGDADDAAGKDDHENAQQLFREAAESFKQSLRLRPGDRSTAWNYELALRRIREQQQKQQEKEQKEKQEQKDQQQQDQQQDQQQQDQQQQDQQQQDQQKQDEKEQEQQKQDEKKQEDQQKQDEQQQKQDQKQQQPQQAQPRSDADRALDALQDGEENLERLKAARRAARERRAPAKDW